MLQARPRFDAEPDIDGHTTLVHLSGPLRGESWLLTEERLTIGTSIADDFIVGPADSPARTLATLVRRGGTYELRAAAGSDVFVNGERTESAILASGDVFDVGGAILRLRIHPATRGPYKTVSEAVGDCIDCARFSEAGLLSKAGMVVAGVPYELVTATRPRMRVAFIGVLLLFAISSGLAVVNGVRLERRLNAELGRIDHIEASLQMRGASYSRNDFEAARAELEALIGESLGRVEALEERAGAAARIIAETGDSVVFVQGSYGFLGPDGETPLRLATGPAGRPVRLPDGSNAIALAGDGPIVEVFFTGTAFVVGDEGQLLTNRHIALPWQYDPAARQLTAQGFSATMRRLLGFLPGAREPVAVELIAASDTADVAVLAMKSMPPEARPLELADAMPIPGDEVILLGYPTGMRAIIARAGEHFGRVFGEGERLDFWQVAVKLAEGGYLKPLATRGIVGQRSDRAIAYDAATISGGSGGPVIDLEGRVVAINAAVIAGFGGSNLGVPVPEARQLLASLR